MTEIKQSSMLSSIPLKEISIGNSNPRKTFSQDHMDELVESIKKFGVLQPIVIRPHLNGDGYELVCGERRFRASISAGFDEIPCSIRNLTDDEAFELQITENLQRQDINPMEESDAFHQLTKRGMTTAEKIAKQLHKSPQYVYDRLALQKCISEVQNGVRNGKLSISVGKQFARLTQDDQEKLFERVDLEDLSTIKKGIQEFSLDLNNAQFDTNDTKLVPKAGSCKKCPKRSGCNQLLFDDISAKDICFDKSCYEGKTMAHIELAIAKLEGEGKKVHRISARYQTELPGVLKADEWDEVDKEEEEFETADYGIYVELPTYSYHNFKLGELIRINVDTEEEEEEEDFYSTKPSSNQSVSTSNSSATREEGIDWDKEFARRAITSVWNLEYEALHENEYNYLLNNVAHKLARLDLEHQIFICKLIGLELAPEDTDSESSFYKEQINAKRATGGFWMSVGGTGELLTLLYIVELADDYLDTYTSFEDHSEFYEFEQRAKGVDFKTLGEAINTEAGETVISISEPESE